MDEFIAAPTNLSISGQELSWDAVTNADGYIVYANDVELDKVGADVTTFDFSSEQGDVLVFQVRTRAPRGMQDSPLSAKIAYVVDRAGEIEDVNTALTSMSMPFVPGFAEKLVDKGMVAEDVENMSDAFDAFQTAIENAEDYEDYLAAINALLENVDNVEAIVSAVVNTYLKDFLEEEIDDLEFDLENGFVWDVESAEQELAVYQELLDTINEDPDTIVLSITTTIEYLLEVESLVSEDLVGLVQNIAETDDVENLNVDEVYQVKQEIVSILRESLPSQEEMGLIVELVDLLQSMSGAGLESYSSVENYKGKIAAQSLYQIEIFINFLDAFEKSDIQGVVDNSSSNELTDDMANAENIIILVKVFDRFYDDNQNLFDTFEAVFTDEEKELIYEDSIEALADAFAMEYDIPSEAAIGLYSSLDFSTLLDMQVILEDGFEAVLNELVASDCEIIRQIAISEGYYRDYSTIEGTYENVALDEVYTKTEFYYERNLTDARVQQYSFNLVNAWVQTLNETKMNTITTMLVDQIFKGLVTNMFDEIAYGAPFNQAAALDALVVVNSTLLDSNGDIIEFVKNAMKYAVDQEVFMDYIDVLTDVHNYMKSEYGVNYEDDYVYDEVEDYARLIYMASHYVNFMNNSNRGLLNDILDNVFTAMKDNDVQAITNMSSAQVDQLDTEIGELLDEVKSGFDAIDRFDATNLSEANITKINEVLDDIQLEAEDIPEIFFPSR